ncbi:hypothetical protein [Pedobacter montanisoli]|uniref:Uncharacterized protein n=1 Tax=Pedobacter montanisoli TaxID=2923277 RepID=A0ABS9ZYJ5_9SPHI|nr:hypothetical protein [Pedobacter montanisoli]MCJ0743383.1 hypothetical protein [Pedobacter montanisoli]
MKRPILFLLFFVFSAKIALAQDTSAYNIQRAKINSMLAERSAKFSQYDESLKARTGIFGLQTKQDIRNSNEILRTVVMNDNNIFQELKVLLEYKDIQFKQAQTDADFNTQRIINFKTTIRDLQLKNDELLNYNNKISKNSDYKTLTIVLAVIIIIILLLLLRKAKLNAKKSNISSIQVK